MKTEERKKELQIRDELVKKVFELANQLAVAGYGDEAVKMHGICNRLSNLKK